MIEAIDILKSYKIGDTTINALNHVSLQIKQGEFVAVMGDTGSGKSTFLHALGLLDPPSEGEIIINGYHGYEFDDNERTRFRLTHLGYVFQNYALIPELTALENIMLPVLLSGETHQRAKKLAIKVLTTVELQHRLDHLPSELSGGQQQRVAIARAIVNKPTILFADEPCANLDSKTSEQILKLFTTLNKQYGLTIVMVTHEEWHRKYVGRTIFMRDGEILWDKKDNRKYNKKVKDEY